ncbi:alpha/beta fold hydrolase [Thiorhodospira sibirica]|uniref:alpha/beta fold hydrolase n=1 Tax=Thiorhodospira sibirica TaxID=154347 RepID=UPI00022C0ABE|nr:alpha/beta hydrolase [Thiorhodospira sibirica]
MAKKDKSETSYPPLSQAVSGQRCEISPETTGRLSYYKNAPENDTQSRPLLLIHTINAAGSAYEVRPLYEHYAKQRPVYAPDLPGFGFSDRSAREYTIRLMTDAIHEMVKEIQKIHGEQPIDAIAVSLGSEFLARAAQEKPESFRSIGLISPTGFNRSTPKTGAPESHRGKHLLYHTFNFPLWAKGFFNTLTSRSGIRFFLNKTWGSKDIDEGMLNYDCLTTRQPGAHHAPFYFVSGFLFSRDIREIYQNLQHPVWFIHGVRGDFIDFVHKNSVEGKPNWSHEVFSTGALPHFEMPTEVAASYDAFLTKLA